MDTKLNTVVTLSYGYEGQVPKSGLFEALLNQTLPVVKHYRCDYYHDAMWISHHVPRVLEEGESFTFYYGARETGTSIQSDLKLSKEFLKYNTRAWTVTVTNLKNKITVSFEAIQ